MTDDEWNRKANFITFIMDRITGIPHYDDQHSGRQLNKWFATYQTPIENAYDQWKKSRTSDVALLVKRVRKAVKSYGGKIRLTERDMNKLRNLYM